MKYKRVVIIGMGLIGGSIGKALIAKEAADEVVGVCRRETSLERAKEAETFTEGYINNYEEAVRGAEIIVIATPVHTIKEVLEQLSNIVKDTDVLVTDVGSTKEEIVSFAGKYKESFSFVGSHPLAGSEQSGVEYAKADLFDGSLCVVTNSGATNENVKKICVFWETLGARVEEIEAGEHDEILSFTSHLPHVVAYALSGVQKEKCVNFASTGFKDTTRVASSDPELWSDIFLSNRDNVLEAIKQFGNKLSRIEQYIIDKDEEKLKKLLEECKRMRDGIV